MAISARAASAFRSLLLAYMIGLAHMFSCRQLVLSLGIFFSACAWGQDAWKDSDKKEIEKTVTEYTEIFAAKAFDKLSGVLETPFVGVFGAGPIVMKTMDELTAYYRRIREPLDAGGYVKSTQMLSQGRLSVLSDTTALLNIPYRRYKTGGVLLEDGAMFYIFSKTSGKWKISGLLPQDPKWFGKVY